MLPTSGVCAESSALFELFCLSIAGILAAPATRRVLSIISWTLRILLSRRTLMLVSISWRLRSAFYSFSAFLSSSNLRRSSISALNLASCFFWYSSSFFWRAFFSRRSLFTRSWQASAFSPSYGVALLTGSTTLLGILTGLRVGDDWTPFLSACSTLSCFRFSSSMACFSKKTFDFSASLFILAITPAAEPISVDLRVSFEDFGGLAAGGFPIGGLLDVALEFEPDT